MYLFFKRIFDLIIAIVILIFLSPLLLIVAALIKREDGGRILYEQLRIGRNQTLFSLYKFRSMTDIKRTSCCQTFLSSPEVTRIGRIIRRFKIDELPQLMNVVKGDMSLVGPRPCLPETITEFGYKSVMRHSIRPGLTGLAQVSGNIYLSWRERLEYDLRYIDDVSFFVDCKILLKTLIIILLGEKWGKKC